MMCAGECRECGHGLIDMTGGDGHYYYRCPECDARWQEWRCRFCGEKFEEQPDRYDCPNCGPNDSRIYK